ncbi:hypothetical protein [Mesorhizobium sp.]|uniref:hypothetical protein n=1 Tax=Mesorhizobium TaxID=68287 RepID=UPI000FE59FB4|nr:hypothetical protein [Mesorhizobium sp.]RWO19318.1 MAG: hypothetical protein EOS09_31760 [Mesorhizobium sp.]
MFWVIGIGIGLFLLFTFPRQVFMLLGVIVAVGCAGGAYWWINNRIDERVKAAVITDARWSAGVCPETNPVKIIFQNNSDRIITRIWFNLVGHRQGFSEPVSTSSYLNTDKILVRGETYSACWSYRQSYGEAIADAAALDWTAELSEVRYK